MNFVEYYFVESINDKNLFKAVFFAGGPGSGKSFISDLAFKGEPVSFINQDHFLEIIFKRDDIPFEIDSNNKEVYAKQQDTRRQAKKLMSQRMLYKIDGMLPLVIDGTARFYEKIEELHKSLSNVGYDCYMIFVNTSLEVAKERNANRQRKIPEKFVVDSWQQVQDNLGHFQDLFGANNFIVVDNSRNLDEQETKNLEMKLIKISRKFLNEPLKNPVGKKIIEKMKETGAQNISDLSDTLKKDTERFAL
jgi:predicted kinase